jgi:plasmid stabilization system protein ParE
LSATTVVYRVDGDLVTVLAVIHGRRDLREQFSDQPGVDA